MQASEGENTIASGERGLTTGHIFDRSGQLMASVYQESLIRPRSFR